MTAPCDPFDPLGELPEALAEWRAGLTFEEREIIALERISDQMALLAAAMRPAASTAPLPQVIALNGAQGDLPLGIEMIETRHYAVGHYRYTALKDAMAQLERDRNSP